MSIIKIKSFSPKELQAFIIQEPMLSYFFARSEIIEDENFNAIAAVKMRGGKPILTLNPCKLIRFSTEERIGILVHEFLHVLMLHCTARQKHSGKKALKENIAMDLAINQLIARSSWSLPDIAVMHDKHPFDLPAGKSAEVYYDLIDENFSDDEIESLFGHNMMDEHDWTEATASDNLAVKDILSSYVRNCGREYGSTLAGVGGRNIVERILSVRTNDVDWLAESKKFVQSITSNVTRRTYKRPSRRYPFPSQGILHEARSNVAAIVDTSESIPKDFLSQVAGNLNKMSLVMGLDVLMCDTDIKGNIKKYRASSWIDFKGRGGTDLRPAIEYAIKNKYDGIVIFTDGYFSLEGLECGIPTLWIVINNRKFTAPFGRSIVVNKGK